jgi:TPR repeat protein
MVFFVIVLFPGDLHAGEPLREQAERGDPGAQFRMGMDYLNGRHVPKDSKKAVYWLRKSAREGYSWAQVWLGMAYRNGWGVPKDPAKALKWWQKAAEEGNPWAQDRFNGEY